MGQADVLCELLVLEEYTPHQIVEAALAKKGYPEKDVDKAMKALGRIARRDMGWL